MVFRAGKSHQSFANFTMELHCGFHRKITENWETKMASALRLALIQSKYLGNKSQTLVRARELIKQAAENKAQLICLPECFNSPYGVQYFSEYSEEIPGETSTMLSDAARNNSIYLVGGSIPEQDDGKLYNTCMTYAPDGSVLAKYRKIHLFDIDVPGGIKFTESEVLSPGDTFSTFNIGPWKIGLGICYDMRFEEVAKFYAEQDCNLLLFPGAFNMTTGPLHWELLIRSRAVDHQCYTAACSPARDEKASYVSWAQSTICDPWAKVTAKAGTDEEIIYADLDLTVVEQCRKNIPKLQQKRPDVYKQS